MEGSGAQHQEMLTSPHCGAPPAMGDRSPWCNQPALGSSPSSWQGPWAPLPAPKKCFLVSGKKKKAEFENCKIKLNFILSVLFCLRCDMAHSQQPDSQQPDSPVLQRCLKSYSRCSISTGNQQHLVHRERSKCFPGSKRPVFVMISKLDLLLCEGTTVFIYVCR